METLFINHRHLLACRHLFGAFAKSVSVLQYSTPITPSDRGYFTCQLTDNRAHSSYIVANQRRYHDEEMITSADGAHYRLALLRTLFRVLTEYCQYRPPWGILVGVRPSKLVNQLHATAADRLQLKRRLTNDYLVSAAKAELAMATAQVGRQMSAADRQSDISLYISIPFCPSRCDYCSFPSFKSRRGSQTIAQYTRHLITEITQCAPFFAGRRVISIYFGGGTPALLTSQQISQITATIRRLYDVSALREFSFEAGRPELIDRELLQCLKQNGVDRLAINPQTMHDATLAALNRQHTSQQIISAFQRARSYNFETISADLIAALPGESAAQFMQSLAALLTLRPENITVHSLAIKRAAKLARTHRYQPLAGGDVTSQFDSINRYLADNGYRAYYMYRQKQIAGGMENIGYTREGHSCYYNVIMMEERQTISGFGAGAISKFYQADSATLTRVANVKDYQAYGRRLAEMVARKQRAVRLSD